jgi:hypothetical protein
MGSFSSSFQSASRSHYFFKKILIRFAKFDQFKFDSHFAKFLLGSFCVATVYKTPVCTGLPGPPMKYGPETSHERIRMTGIVEMTNMLSNVQKQEFIVNQKSKFAVGSMPRSWHGREITCPDLFPTIPFIAVGVGSIRFTLKQALCEGIRQVCSLSGKIK